MFNERLTRLGAIGTFSAALMVSAGGVRAEEHKFTDVNEARTFVDRADISLTEAIRKAENECGGKIICAEAITGHQLASTPGVNTDHYKIGCLTGNKIVSICVDSDTGRILKVEDVRTTSFDSRDRENTNTDRFTSNDATMNVRSTFRIQRATDLIGKDVENHRGEDLGDVEDLAIDPDREGRVVYVVLGSGGFLGLGEKLFAVPMGAIHMSSNDRKVVLSVEKDRLRNAIGFEKDRWPKMGDPTWATTTHEFYGQRPYWMEDSSYSSSSPALRIQKASDIIGRPVHNDRGENIGEIKDLAVDVPNGRIAYAVLSFGGFMGMGDKLFAIPPGLLAVPGSGSYVVLHVDRDRLKNAQGFDRYNWPNLADQNFATSVYGYYGQTPYWTTTERR